MKNIQMWRPSKYVLRKGRLSPSNDRQELSPSSRLIAQLIVDAYDDGLKAHARGDLLDLGCGKVPFYEAYRPLISNCTCVDWPGSPHGNLHVDQFCDLSKTLPFNDGTFDTVISSDVIEHLPDPMLAFKEMARVLRPGGKLILNTPFLYMLHEVPHDYYRHTRYSIDRLSTEAGMEVLELRELGGVADVLGDLSAKVVGLIPHVGPPLAAIWQRIFITLAKTNVYQRVRRASASRFPLGYFVVARKNAMDMSATSSPWTPNSSVSPIDGEG